MLLLWFVTFLFSEAHPLDPGALLCCSDGVRDESYTTNENDKFAFQGDRLRKPQAKVVQEESSDENELHREIPVEESECSEIIICIKFLIV